jgi:hypothetical protein
MGASAPLEIGLALIVVGGLAAGQDHDHPAAPAAAPRVRCVRDGRHLVGGRAGLGRVAPSFDTSVLDAGEVAEQVAGWVRGRLDAPDGGPGRGAAGR